MGPRGHEGPPGEKGRRGAEGLHGPAGASGDIVSVHVRVHVAFMTEAKYAARFFSVYSLRMYIFIFLERHLLLENQIKGSGRMGCQKLS